MPKDFFDQPPQPLGEQAKSTAAFNAREKKRKDDEEKKRRAAAEAERQKALTPKPTRPSTTKLTPKPPVKPAPEEPAGLDWNRPGFGIPATIRQAVKPGPIKPSKPHTNLLEATEQGLGTVNEIAKTGVRILDRGITGLVEGVFEAAGTIGLTAVSGAQKLGITPLGELPKKYDPLSSEFEELRINSPKSGYGSAAEKAVGDLIPFVLGTMSLARMLPKIGLAAAAASRGKAIGAMGAAVTGLPAGAIADFLLTKKGDGNLANMVDLLPFGSQEFKDSLKMGLAENDSDNAWTARAKGGTIGSIIGGTADALSFLMLSRKATQGLIRTGMAPEEAIQRGVAEGSMGLQAIRKARAARGDKEWSKATEARFTELETQRIQTENQIEVLKAKIAANPKNQKQLELPLKAVTNPPLTPELKAELDNLKPSSPEGMLAEAQANLKAEAEADPYWTPEYEKARQAVDAATKEVNAQPPTQLEIPLAEQADRVRAKPDPYAEEGTPDPTISKDLDQDDLDLRDLQDRLKAIDQEADQLEADLATPLEMLEDADKIGFEDAADPGQAVATAVRSQTTIPKAARRTDVPPDMFKGDTPPLTPGKMPRVHTDASYKIMSTGLDNADEIMDTIKKTDKMLDVDAIAKAAGIPTTKLLQSTGEFLQNFRPVQDNLDIDVPEFLEILRKNNILTIRPQSDLEDAMEIFTPKGNVAYYNLVTDTAQQLNDLARQFKARDIDQASFGNLTDRITDRIIALHELHKASAHTQGAGLAYFKLRVLQDGPENAVEATKKKLAEITASAIEQKKRAKARAESRQLREWARDLQKAARNGSDPEKLDKFRQMVDALILSNGDPLVQVNITRSIWKGIWDESIINWYNSMLSGVATPIRNIVGGLSNTIEAPTSVLINGFRTNNPATKYAAISAWHGITDSLGDAWTVARRSAQTNFDLHSKPEYMVEFARKEADLATLRASVKPGSSDDRLLGFLEAINVWNKSWAGSYPQRLLLAGDDFFKVVTSRLKISMDAAHETYKATGKADSADFLRRYEEIKAEKIDPETYGIKNEDLMDYTRMMTFNADPGGIATAVNHLIQEAPIMRFAMPFVKVPTNVMIYSAEMSPLTNRLSARYNAVMSLKQGDEGFDPVLRAQYQGRQAISSMVFASASAMAISGNLTGNGPPPGPLRELWLKEGHRPKSIRLPGVGWVSYESIDPIQLFAAAAADVVMLGQMGHLDEAERLRDQLIFTFGMSIVDRSMLQGVVGLSAILDPRGASGVNTIWKSTLGTANAFIPFAGARRNLSNSFEPYRREFDGAFQQIMATAWPGFSQQNPPMINPFTGLPESNVGGGLWNATTPFRIRNTSFPEGSVEERAQKVARTLLEANWDSSTLSTQDSRGIKLKGEQRSRFNKALADVGLLENLENLLAQPWWQEQMKMHKAVELSTEASTSRHFTAISDIVNATKQQAQTILDNDPTLTGAQRVLQNQKRAADSRGDVVESRRLRELLQINQP